MKLFFEIFNEKILNTDSMGTFRSAVFFEKSIRLFRNNGDTTSAENVHRKLIEVQQQIPKKMNVFRSKIDVSGAIANIKTNMDGLSFEECIIRLTQYIGFESIEKIKRQTIEECRKSFVSSMFGCEVLDTKGRIIIKLPPLDINDPEKDIKLLELYMFRSCFQKKQFAGDILIKNILQHIREKFIIEDSMLEFLVNDNCIIPEGRENIFQKGIGEFLRGEYYAAMHILAPQMENLFREIANEVGGLTSTLSSDGTAKEKVLSSVFSLPELLDAYDNDILFAFRGLLNEQAGANIRNRITHGIIDELECSSGACLYFGALVIKLLSYTALACYDIKNNSDKIKDFKILEEDDIKIVE